MEIEYRTTALEDWVSNFYKRLKIYTPSDINEKKIAYNHCVYLNYREENSHYINGRFKSITVDERQDPLTQREIFFHELCHILRHAGRQSMMSAAFRELQERDSRHFTRYASIPYHMLKYLDLESPGVIEEMSGMFKVTPELCVERLLQIQSKIQHKKRERFTNENVYLTTIE
jgi:hypothetical protein